MAATAHPRQRLEMTLDPAGGVPPPVPALAQDCRIVDARQHDCRNRACAAPTYASFSPVLIR
jgi:hypothetical protein